MIELHQLAKHFGAVPIFRSASVRLSSGMRVGLVGPNGSGKTTLLRMICGEEEWESGDIRIRKNCRIGYLPQTLETIPGDTILDAVHGGQYAAHEAERLLSGLGFDESQFDAAMQELSGGYRMRVALAQILIAEPDVLVLDEPTNHLDAATQQWFENFLVQSAMTLLVVSHDTEFLDRLVSHVWEIFGHDVRSYTGNYTKYTTQRDARRAQLEAQAKSQQRKVDQLTRFVDRFRSKATKATQVQSRLKELKKIKRVEVERKQRTLQFDFPQPAPSGQVVLSLRNVAKSYGDNTVYTNLDFTVERGERVALLGENGAGKSTLLKILAGAIAYDAGERVVGHNATLHYFAQHQTEVLDAEHTVLDSIAEAQPDEDFQWIRKVAGIFLFSGDDQYKPISVLSGGEKSRVALARMLVKPANTLLLDEPTNHLDPAAVDMLTDALQRFVGTIIFISHDPVFLSRIANRCVEVDTGRTTDYVGDYEYYLWKRSQELGDGVGADAPSSSATPKEKKTSGAAQVRRECVKALNRSTRQVERLEEHVAGLEEKVAALDVDLCSEATYADYERWQRLEAEHNTLKATLDSTIEQWQDKVEESDRLRAELASLDAAADSDG